MREAAQRTGIRVALPDDVDVAHGDVDRDAVANLQRDIRQHAVAQIDRVVETEQPARCAQLAGEVLEDPLTADAGVGVLARRRERRGLGRALRR